jgi:CBS domain-containing protein
VNAIVKDVMTTEVISVREDAPFEAIAAALRQRRVSAVPVIDDLSRVIGVVSESDLLTKLAFGIDDDEGPGVIAGILHHRERVKAHAVTAADLMTSPPITASPHDSVEQAARLMYSRNVKRLPVIDADGRLVGIVSRADVLVVYSRTDTEIVEEIRHGILANEEPAEPGVLDVSVKDGVVTIVGRPQTATQGHDIIRRAEHVEGVVAVRDRLDYPARELSAFDAAVSFPVD